MNHPRPFQRKVRKSTNKAAFGSFYLALGWVVLGWFMCSGLQAAPPQANVAISPVARQAFINEVTHVPLGGGKLCTYVAGTTTPLQTYVDSTGTAVNTNPIILDAAGMANIWLITGAKYKFILYDHTGTANACNGVLQWSVDGITSAPGSTGGSSPSPPDHSIQTGVGGDFVGFADFLWDDANQVLLVGSNVVATSTANQFVIGNGNQTQAANEAVLGINNTLDGIDTYAFGKGNQTTNDDEVASGINNTVAGTHSQAYGDTNDLTSDSEYAFGSNNTVHGNTAFAFGHSNNLSNGSSAGVGFGNVAIGLDNTCSHDSAVVAGVGALCLDDAATPTSGAFMGFSTANVNVRPYALGWGTQTVQSFSDSLATPGTLQCAFYSVHPKTLDCGSSPGQWMGIANTYGVVTDGIALVNSTNTAVPGHTVCQAGPASSAVTDNGSTNVCVTGVQVGVVLSVTEDGSGTTKPEIIIARGGGAGGGGGGGIPNAATPACYASPFGVDSADGLTPATPKKSAMGCYDAFIATGYTAFTGGGVIYLYNGGPNIPTQACTDADLILDPSCGIKMMGVGDPNYPGSGPLPTGWRPDIKGVDFKCYAGVSPGSFAQGNQCALSGGGATHPNVWLSDTFSHHFDGLQMTGRKSAMWIGVDSNGNAGNDPDAVSSWNTQVTNSTLGAGNTVGYGPAVLIGTRSDWTHFSNDSFSANNLENAHVSCTRASNVETCVPSAPTSVWPSWSGTLNLGFEGFADTRLNRVFSSVIGTTTSLSFTYNGPDDAVAKTGIATSDRGAVMLVNPNAQSSFGSGILNVEKSWFGSGGIRYYAGDQGGNLIAKDIFYDNSGTAGMVPIQLIGCNGILSENNYHISDVFVADNTIPLPGLNSDVGAVCKQNVIAENTSGLEGSASGSGSALPLAATSTPSALRQFGILGGAVYGQVDAARRQFGPSAVPNGLTPLVMQVPSLWGTNDTGAHCSNLTIGTSYQAPDGTMGAGLITPGSGLGKGCFYSKTLTTVAGDYVIFGAWSRSTSANGYQNGTTIQATLLTGSFSTTATSHQLPALPTIGGGGEWQWNGTWGRVTVGAVSDALTIEGYSGSTHPTAFYAPTALYIPASAGYTDNEIAEIAQNLQSLNSTCAVGSACFLAGQTLQVDAAVIKALTITGFSDGCLQIASGIVSSTGITCGGGAGGTAIFDSYQFGTNTPITTAGNFFKLTYDSNFAPTYSGAGSSGSPFIATLKLASSLTGVNASTATALATLPTPCPVGSAGGGVDTLGSSVNCLPNGASTLINYYPAYGPLDTNAGTDDTANLVAFAAACTAPGTTMIMPPGRYKHNSTTPLVLSPGCNWRGGGGIGGGPGTGGPQLAATTIEEYAAAPQVATVNSLSAASYKGGSIVDIAFADKTGACSVGGGVFVANVSYFKFSGGVQNFCRPAVSAPTTPTPSPSTSGGTILAGTHPICIEDADAFGHRTLCSTPTNAVTTGSTSSVALASHTVASPMTVYNVFMDGHLIHAQQASGTAYTITASSAGGIAPTTKDESAGSGLTIAGSAGNYGLSGGFANQNDINIQCYAGTLNCVVADQNVSMTKFSGISNLNMGSNASGVGAILAYATGFIHTEGGASGSTRVALDNAGGDLIVGCDVLVGGETCVDMEGASRWNVHAIVSVFSGSPTPVTLDTNSGHNTIWAHGTGVTPLVTDANPRATSTNTIYDDTAGTMAFGFTTGAPSFTSGVDNASDGSFVASNSAASAHTTWGSAATTSNVIKGFATVPTTGHTINCTVSGVTCTLTDAGAPQVQIPASWLGTIPGSQVINRIIFAKTTIFPSSLTGSVGNSDTAATASTVITFSKNGSSFGTCTFAISGSTCTFAAASPTTFTAGTDVLKITGPASPDATLANVSITLLGTD